MSNLKEALECGDINRQDNEGKTALHYAVEQGDVEIISLLLDAGASFILPDKQGSNAVDAAVMSNNTNNILVVKTLLDYGCNLDKDMNINIKYEDFISQILLSRLEVVTLLLHFVENVHELQEKGRSIIIGSACDTYLLQNPFQKFLNLLKLKITENRDYNDTCLYKNIFGLLGNVREDIAKEKNSLMGIDMSNDIARGHKERTQDKLELLEQWSDSLIYPHLSPGAKKYHYKSNKDKYTLPPPISANKGGCQERRKFDIMSYLHCDLDM